MKITDRKSSRRSSPSTTPVRAADDRVARDLLDIRGKREETRSRLDGASMKSRPTSFLRSRRRGPHAAGPGQGVRAASGKGAPAPCAERCRSLGRSR